MDELPPRPRRPLSLLGFELATLTLLAVSLAQFRGPWSELRWLPVVPLLALGVSRLRSRIARWLLTVLYALGFGFVLLLFGGNPLGFLGLPPVTRLIVLLALAQIVLLWAPATTEWLWARRRRGWDGSRY
jgi:hypothetical protein